MSFEHGLPSFEDVQEQVQIEVFGAKRMQAGEVHVASQGETEQFKMALLTAMDKDTCVGTSRLAINLLERNYNPGTLLILWDTPPDPGGSHPASSARFRTDRLIYEETFRSPFFKKHFLLGRVLGIIPMVEIKEDILIDLVDKPWVVKIITDSLSKEMKWAVKPATGDDMRKALEALAVAVGEDEELRSLRSSGRRS